jgi:predicted nucleotidyltransferase
MLKNLFSSETRILLLSQFLMNPDKEFYLRQISGKFGLSPRLVSLELQNLEKIELLKKRVSGKQHYFAINKQHQLFEDLRNIFLKTVGLKDVIEKHLDAYLSQIEFAFIYGSIAKGNAAINSDVDLMIIGNLSNRKISGSMLQAGTELDREINFSIFAFDEFKSRIKNNDHFITTIINEPKIFITRNSDEFERLAKE